MRIELEVVMVAYADEGATVYLRWPMAEPGTAYFPSIPARCDHNNVKVGDWWALDLQIVARDGKVV